MNRHKYSVPHCCHGSPAKFAGTPRPSPLPLRRLFSLAVIGSLLWGTDSFGQIRSTLKGHQEEVWEVAIAPDGMLAATSSWRTVRVWDLNTAKAVFVLQPDQLAAGALAFSPDGKFLITANVMGGTCHVRRWHLPGGQEASRITCARDDRTLVLSPDGKYVALGGIGDPNKGAAFVVKVYDTETGKLSAVLDGHDRHVTAIAFSAKSALIVSGSEDGKVKLWDRTTKKALKTVPVQESAISALAFSADDKILAIGSSGRYIRLYNFPDATLRNTLFSYTNSVKKLQFTPDAKILAIGGGNDLQLWSQPCGAMSLLWKGHRERILSVAISLDGKTAITGGEDKEVRVWDLPRKEITRDQVPNYEEAGGFDKKRKK